LSGFRYLLRSGDGTELGDVSFAVPDWHEGDEFQHGGRRFRIVRIDSFLEELRSSRV
jgi:hypothetical protein